MAQVTAIGRREDVGVAHEVAVLRTQRGGGLALQQTWAGSYRLFFRKAHRACGKDAAVERRGAVVATTSMSSMQ
jgi:hypothetical protein